MERRDFLKTTVGAGMALVGVNLISCQNAGGNATNYNPKGLPTILFGSTGVRIPRIVLGLGSRFCHMDSDQEAYDMLNFALDNGLYYFDTAHNYDNSIALPPWKEKPTRLINSEERVGEVVKTRRKEIFLSTKISARDASDAMRKIELSLKRLHTDRLDMLKIHGVDTMEDVNRMSEKGNMIDFMIRMKEEKVTRFIGFSTHLDNESTKELLNRGPFDSMLIAMNHYSPRQQALGLAWPTVKDKKMGLLLMKAVRPKETIAGLKATDLVRYALSLDGPDALALGMDGVDIVKSNVDLLKNFQKMDSDKMRLLTQQLAPFYRHENLPWMQKGYCDGHWSS